MFKSSHFKAARATRTVPAITARVAAEGTEKLKPLLCGFSPLPCRLTLPAGLFLRGFLEAKKELLLFLPARAGFWLKWLINPALKPADLLLDLKDDALHRFAMC